MGRRSSQKDRETRVGRGSRASQQPMTLGRLEHEGITYHIEKDNKIRIPYTLYIKLRIYT